MSGRDFKTFLASHQSQIGQPDNRLMTRFLSGQKLLYKPVDYEQLRALTKVKQSAGEQSLKNMEQLTKQNNDGKKQQLLSEHKHIWEKEVRKLKEDEQKIENEIQLLQQPSVNLNSSLNKLYQDVTEYESSLKCDLPDFIENTIQPIHNLCTDIKYYIERNRDKLFLGIQNNNDILDILQSVKQQQALIMDQLDAEQETVEHKLHTYIHVFSTSNVHLPEIKIGIPDEILLLDCPDKSLEISCLNEFDMLNEKYVSKLECLEEKYESAIKRAPYGGWSEKDHFCFNHIMSQYNDVTKNQRKLYIDCLKRVLKHMTITTITKHEEWWLSYKSFRQQVKHLFHAWKRDNEGLTSQVSSLFQEATSEYESKKNDTVDHMKQVFKCNYLHNKLLQYQTERLEQLKLEESHQAAEEEEINRRMTTKALKEKNRRERNKHMILVHKDEQEREIALCCERDRIRMTELQEKTALQHSHNLGRVQFRQEKYKEKVCSEKTRQQLAEAEAIEKERRLQLLRDQVVVTVEHNPHRIYEQTEAFKAHIAVVENEEMNIQKPLFNVYSYSVDQIAQDKRLKIENALRRANLHMTDYGRQILSNIPPPTKPRKDTQSIVFKFTE